MKFKIDKFIIAIITIVLVAYLFPSFGSKSSPFNLDLIASLGISLIFFFYGLKLSPEKIKAGLKNWKLHLLVQVSTFLVFPLIVLLFLPFIQTEHNKTIWLAFFFLASLPSTVSSSVVMVSIAKGNIPAAIFNASISGLIGIAVTPLWMGMFLNNSNSNFDLGTIYIKLLTEVLLPVILGLFLHRYLGKLASKYGSYLSTFDKSVILLIIYKSFATSFDENVFNSLEASNLVVIIICVIILFYLVYFVTGIISTKLGFNREDRITAQFCGTKKSLVHGTIFSKILFQNAATMGIVLLPIMIFHGFQIFIISIIANKLANPVKPL
ncbi:bile acid:sodium symporter family protein [Flavobacterium algicola]|uniref:bile acid:sodium symporter family protein n=1 Tax=Flavobacterium algicola TaxID=556529 RepID=UPI001EFD4681|nr:bile acid:sodium symporter family protein [Flavobacterium algicola]MCG9790846.1 bile acid:sodium symporter [Flavobacterium algicola]